MSLTIRSNLFSSCMTLTVFQFPSYKRTNRFVNINFKTLISQRVSHKFEILCTYARHPVKSENLVAGIFYHGVDVLSAVQNKEGWFRFRDTVAHDDCQTTFVLFQEPDSNCYFALFEIQELFDF